MHWRQKQFPFQKGEDILRITTGILSAIMWCWKEQLGTGFTYRNR